MTITIITSAAVGTLVASIVSLLGQTFERQARRKALLLSKAIELAFARREFTMAAADRAGQTAGLRDDAFATADYYRVLEEVLDTGHVPEFFVQREAKGPIQGARRS